MPKIVKKKDLDVLIENTIKESMPLGRAMGTAAAIVAPLAALVLSVQHENFISVTDKTGNERTPEKGETFVGKIIDLEEPEFLKGGTIVTMETKNGEIVKFQHRVKVRGNVGETIKVKVESGTFIWPDYDVKHTNESTSNKKPLINENIQKELDLFNKLSNYTFKK